MREKMKYSYLHEWNILPKEGVEVQKELREKLVFDDERFRVRTVCGTDVSYDRGSDIHYSAVVMDFGGTVRR